MKRIADGLTKERLVAAVLVAFLATPLALIIPPAVNAQGLSPQSPKLAIETKAVEIGLSIDPTIAKIPALFETLKIEAEAAAETFQKDADADFAERGNSGSWNAWFLDRVYQTVFDSERAISVLTSIDTYSGGAHPNQETETILFDKSAEQPLDLAVLMPDFTADGAAFLEIQAYIRERLNFERGERLGIGDLPPEDMEWVEMGTEDTASLSRFTLVQTEAGNAATGLRFHFPPYQVGSYAEGAYSVEVPVLVFASHLAPGYTDLFEDG